MIVGNPRASGTTMKKTMRAATSDKANAKKYTLQRCRRTLVNQSALSYVQKFQNIQGYCEAWSAIPGNGHAEMRSVNNVFEVAGVIYAAGLEMCIQGMNVSFLDTSHSKSNEYEGTHVILCGQGSQGGMRVIGHAMVPVENSHYYNISFEIFYGYRDSSGQSILQAWLDHPDHVQFSDRMKGFP